jgi:hypothetical protein
MDFAECRPGRIRNAPECRSSPGGYAGGSGTKIHADHRPDGEALSEPSIKPDESYALHFRIDREFGDEWGNKWMFHRWGRDVDQQFAGRIAYARPKASEQEHEAFAAGGI